MKRNGSMNHIYRLVWSQVRQAWVAVAENTSGRGKGKNNRRRLIAAAMSLTTVTTILPDALASPTGGQVVSGTATINQSGNTTTINQSSNNVSLNWASFDIGTGQTVNFVQPSATSVAVNRILGNSGTQIMGNLDANGQVFLINPNGIIFGRSAQVNVGGLIASTLDLTSNPTGAGVFSFSGNGSGSVANQGTINTKAGGYVGFVGNTVSNTGSINATMGTVAFGAGSTVTVTFANNRLLHLQVDQSTLNNLATNGGIINANGGAILLSAGAKDALLASVVNNSGILEAQTVSNQAGTITLLGGQQAGTINVGGTIDASAPRGGPGGSIETSAGRVIVANNANVLTSSSNNQSGLWLIDPVDFNVAASGGDITGAALSSALSKGNVTISTSASTASCSGNLSGGAGSSGTGNININDATNPVTWGANTLTLNAFNNININAPLMGSGTAGLSLLYGQGSANGVINTITANYNINAPVNLASTGSFTTRLGSSGSLINYTIITSAGAAGSTTGTDLQGVNGNLQGNFVLGSDINVSSISSFSPLGPSQNNQFNGIFDGLDHAITGLSINLPTTSGVGLFGYIGMPALVQNVRILSGSVIGGGYTGGLAGLNYGTINNASFAGTVRGIGGGATPYYVGGLVGTNYGTISNSYSSGTVTATGLTAVGGLVGGSYGSSTSTGQAMQGRIANSWSNANVSGDINTQRLGGLVGSNGSGSNITNSYANGAVNGSSYVGGLIGLNNGVATNVYATGRVNGGNGNNTIGGLIGQNGSSGSVNNGYWNTDVDPQGFGLISTGTATGGGLTTASMQNPGSFSGFNFSSTTGAIGNNWVIVNTDGSINGSVGNGATYPMLTSEYSTAISNAHQLQLIAMAPGASYILLNNIDASATALASTNNVSGNSSATAVGNDIWSTNAGFIPIGGAGTSASAFSGNFNGQGNTITGLTINLPITNNVGLFGTTASNASITNLTLTNVAVSGAQNVGALVGSNAGAISSVNVMLPADNATPSGTAAVMGTSSVGGLVGTNTATGVITNSNVNSGSGGAVSATGNNVGGLVGSNFAAVNTSTADVTVINQSGGTNIGGLVGQNQGGRITTSSAGDNSGNGTIVGNQADITVGGLVGLNNGGSISSSSSVGQTVIGGQNVGGLVGSNSVGSTITSSHATNAVSGTTDVGGLVGINSLDNGVASKVVNSYASGTVTGSTNVGGVIGENDGSASGISSASASIVTGASNSIDVGGLVGSNLGTIQTTAAGSGNSAVLSSAAGSVSGTSNVGGVAGFNSGTISGATVTIPMNGAVASINGSNIVGGLVGENATTGTISHVTVGGTGSVASSLGAAGGLVGLNYGTINTGTSSVAVSGASDVGGLVGINLAVLAATNGAGSISNSSASGAISGASYVGGLVGTNGANPDLSLPINPSSAIYGGAIINSQVSGIVVNGSGSGVGGLIGFSVDGTVSGSSAAGTVNGIGSNVGGLIGSSNSTNISNSNAAVAVTGSTNNIGGLVGYNQNATITTSTASGAVAIGNATLTSNGNFVGGLVGLNAQGTITGSSASGEVNGNQNVGGLAGGNQELGSATIGSAITSSLATGTVAGTTNIGGLVGLNDANSTITTSYASGKVNGITQVAGNPSTSTTPTNLGGLVGMNNGVIAGGQSHAGSAVAGGTSSNNVGGLVGNNSATGLIETAVTGTANAPVETQSSASGSVSGGTAVGGLIGSNSGHVDSASVNMPANSGSGSVIEGVQSVGGLVGVNTATGSIESVTVGSSGSGTVMASGNNAGGVAGVNNGFISEATSTVSVSGINNIGGLVGLNNLNVSASPATIANSNASGSVTGNSQVGGLVGANNGVIVESYALGTVQGSNMNVGGLVGYNYGGGEIGGSFAKNSVSGVQNVGGLVGANYGSSLPSGIGSIISTSYSSGTVTGNLNVGGLLGFNDSQSSVTDTYSISLVNAVANGSTAARNVAALVGENAGSVSGSFWNSSVSGNLSGVNNGPFNLTIGGVTSPTTGTIDSTSAALTNAGFTSASNFINAGWSIATTGGQNKSWLIYNGNSMPLLDSFLTPITITVSNSTTVFNGTNQGAYAATLSTISCSTGACPSNNISGTLFGTAINSGTYAATGTNLSSSQFGYDITVTGTGRLTIIPFIEPSGSSNSGNSAIAGIPTTPISSDNAMPKLSGAMNPDNPLLLQIAASLLPAISEIDSYDISGANIREKSDALDDMSPKFVSLAKLIGTGVRLPD